MTITADRMMALGGKCRVPMWMGGCPAGFCGDLANGPQLPRSMLMRDPPYCFGPCCPAHGGPADNEPIIFQDGWAESGRQMWCAVMPGFRNLQEDAAGFDGNPNVAVRKLRAAMEATP